MSKAKHVVVLKGGLSSEREVSLVSGAACAKALRDLGYAVTEIDVGHNLWEQLHSANPDVIFNALHGDWGEDGRVQGVLDMFGVPYSHSGVLASALAMDKHRAKAVLKEAGINVPQGRLVSRELVGTKHPIKPPYVLKPNGQGSSKGVYIIKAGDGPSQAAAQDADMGELIICEAFISGRELTVAVMDGEPLAVTEIIPQGHEFYDYEAKYGDGGSKHIVPAHIPGEVTEICMEWAKKAHLALGCRGLSRSDFIFSDVNDKLKDVVNKIVMLEVNTQPGMTPMSLAPEQANYKGMDFGQLCRWIVEDASWPR